MKGSKTKNTEASKQENNNFIKLNIFNKYL